MLRLRPGGPAKRFGCWIRRADAGHGALHSSSQITLRMLSRRAEAIDQAFYRRRIEAAIERRRGLVADTDATVVHGEGDLLPLWWWIATGNTW